MSEWIETCLKEYISVSSGEGLPDSKMKPGQYPVYGGNGITGFHNEFLFSESRLIIGRVGALCGNVHITQKNSWITDNALIVSFRNNNQDVYFWYYMLSNLKLREFAFQSAQPVITGGIIDNVRLKIHFSISEQKRIAKILSICDTVIEQTQSAIAKYKAIKQGMLHDLFTRGLDANGHLRPTYPDAPELYKESELGMIPKEWEVKSLGELTEKIGSGVTPTGGSEVYQTSGVLFIRSQNVLVGSLSIEDAAFISTEIDEKMESSRVKPYDVFLNITGASIGRSAYFPVEQKSANVNQHVCIIRFKGISKSLAIYASEFLNSNFGQTQIYKSIAGGNREGLNFQQIRSFSFPSISTAEINKIAKIVELQNNKIQTEETLLQKYQSIKRGLMGDLLGGNGGRKRKQIK